MKKIYITLCLMLASYAQAQVGFGTATPDQSAEIEIQSTNKGMLVPRIALTSATQKLQTNIDNANSLLIYNNGTVLPTGFYYWKANVVSGTDNGTWVAVGSDVSSMPKFFYMPSIVINTGVNATGLTRDLYKEYYGQFTGQIYDVVNSQFVPNPDFIKSENAPALIPNIPLATGLYYYITDYDKTALDNLSIDANGVLTYDVIGSGTDYSFVNIVFVVK